MCLMCRENKFQTARLLLLPELNNRQSEDTLLRVARQIMLIYAM